MRNLSYENEFCMQFHSHANQSHFHNNGFALRLALKQRHKGTRKWPIGFIGCFSLLVDLLIRAQFSAGILARRGSGTSKVGRWQTNHGKLVAFNSNSNVLCGGNSCWRNVFWCKIFAFTRCLPSAGEGIVLIHIIYSNWHVGETMWLGISIAKILANFALF